MGEQPLPNLRLMNIGPLYRATVDTPYADPYARPDRPTESFWGIGENMALCRAMLWWNTTRAGREADQAKERR